MNPRTTLVAVGAVALLVGGIAGYLYGVGSRPRETTTVTVSQQASGAVSGAFAQHVLALDSRNVSFIVSQYAPNATVALMGAGVRNWTPPPGRRT